MGLITSYTVGGFIHVLLALAIIAVLIRIIQGRRVVQAPWNLVVANPREGTFGSAHPLG